MRLIDATLFEIDKTYSTGNGIQYLVINYNGKESENEYNKFIC